ncbi:hypothetical protein N9A94_07400 [Akkermansiaceae bacterium]|nr:hypothetical protein [Akkermansiaceae bacterium]
MRRALSRIIVLLGLHVTATAKDTGETLPVVEMIFFSPKDIEPPKDVEERLGTLALQTEDFFEVEMKNQGYPIKRKKIFSRDSKGKVKVAFVRGHATAGTGKYDRNYQGLPQEIIDTAHKTSRFSRNGDCFWIFVYLGPGREFNGWVGYGTINRGGYGIVRYQPNGDIIGAKTHIHELCHSLTLPHIGPKESDKGDCNLMGPNEPTFQRRRGKAWESFYISESGAARLWHHPIFSGTLDKRAQKPRKAELADTKVTYDQNKKLFKIEGKVDCDLPVHSVIVHDDSSGPNQEYWRKTYVSRPDETGGFSIEVNELSDHDGMLRFFYCIEGGLTSRCESAVVYTFENGKHSIQGFIPHTFPLACGGVEKIVSAQWGTKRKLFLKSAADVSDKIEKKIKNGALSFWIDYKSLGDPEPGKTKYLQVQYQLEGEEQVRRLEVRQDNFLILPPLELAYPPKINK